MEASKKAASVERQERTALARARCRAPEQDPSLAVFGRDVDAYDGQSGETAPEDSTAQDWLVADAARRDFDDETTDGLDAVEEEVRHAAEDLPDDEPWEERVRRKAHELWQSEGGPHGRAEDHWHIAAELVAEEIACSRTDLPYSQSRRRADRGGGPAGQSRRVPGAHRPGRGRDARRAWRSPDAEYHPRARVRTEACPAKHVGPS